VLEVLTVRSDLDWLLCALPFRSPLFEGFDYSEEFLVVYFVVTFPRDMLTRKEDSRSKNALVVVLG
jgi:hypothetical protein